MDIEFVGGATEHQPGLEFECGRCERRIVIPPAGFLSPGHAVCVPCSYREGRYVGSVALHFVGEYVPPTKVWEGDYA